MFYLVSFFVLLALGFHLYRNHVTHRDLARVNVVSFDGEVFHVGRGGVAKRRMDLDAKAGPVQTVVCMPGFLEDMRYFLELYKEADVELILVNSADYHLPFATTHAKSVDWGDNNPYPTSTIEYDAHIVACAVKHLATTDNLIFHGHSRGGAVMLELGKQEPGLVKNAKVVLEAPALPQGRLSGGGEKNFKRVGAYFMPLVFSHNRNISNAALNKMPMMKPPSALKTELIRGLFCAPKNYQIALKNIHNIIEWQGRNQKDLYENFEEISVVVGERDHVLSRRAMIASANMSSRVNVVETKGTNHFISLEKPNYILDAAGL
ncbi:hypothetical protein A9Q99_19110 [Gammaproteobacteria bacterium 45_16_T64]|nr:hypothetical protein A9Q99_19110 [Gammaproteobacteria bacterium 45_16_T64]